MIFSTVSMFIVNKSDGNKLHRENRKKNIDGKMLVLSIKFNYLFKCNESIENTKIISFLVY